MQATSKKLSIRGLNHHIQEWGNPKLPSLFFLHGWMDCGESFHYIASELVDSYHLIAPDFRGFGESEHAPGGYWFPDYFADLDALLTHYSPNDKANLVGHSMGGNIALMYAGICPDRVNKVLSLEALGLKQSSPDESPEKYRKWLSQVSSNKDPKIYANLTVLEQAIQANNPSLSQDVIHSLALSWSKPFNSSTTSQERVLKHDLKHRYINPIRYNHDDAIALWKLIEAEVGLVMADNSSIFKQYTKSGRLDDAKQILRVSDNDYFVVDNAHHMLHLEQPKQTANCIKQFFNTTLK